MEIMQLTPTLPRHRLLIERFLSANALRLDTLDYYAAMCDEGNGEIIAGGGLHGATIKCLAVSAAHRDEDIAGRLVSHLLSVANAAGHHTVRVFTKPCYRTVFESMSFKLLAEAPEAVFMETGIGGIDEYTAYLRKCRDSFLANEGTHHCTGTIVMNANPFTLGHQYLVREAARKVDRLFVIAVKEDVSEYSYAERLAMIEKGCADLDNVYVCHGSDYAISSATFPTYFLKTASDATDTQMALDLDLYKRHIAPALGSTVRFAGSEPDDTFTRQYNNRMMTALGNVAVVERLRIGGETVSASTVRRHIATGNLTAAATLVPKTSLPYLVAHLATRALTAELDTTPKPGLVDRHDNGAHRDMDHQLMAKSIATLHPYFVKLALLAAYGTLPSAAEVHEVGIEAERAMLQATHGVNTHRGALFSIGLAVVAATYAATKDDTPLGSPRMPQVVQKAIASLAAGFSAPQGTHGAEAQKKQRAKGALAMARDGYADLFGHWLPFRQSLEGDSHAMHKTLLRIMQDLDDTNILHRTDGATLAWVKGEAQSLLGNFSEERTESLNRQFISRGISPGGSADMLALTEFMLSVCRHRNAYTPFMQQTGKMAAEKQNSTIENITN